MFSNRWVILIASTLINICIGLSYIWSVFSGPIMELFGWTAAATAMIYTVCNSVGPIPMIIGGKLLNKYGPRKVVLIFCIVYSGGYCLSGFANSIVWLCLTYGVCVGVGMAIIYICTISNTIRFFPDKKGLVSGILTAGTGVSTVIAAPIVQSLIDSTGVLGTFKVIGIVCFVVIFICAFFLKKAPDSNDNVNTGITGFKGKKNYSSFEMLKTPLFYLLLAIFMFGAIGGLMVISQASNMAQEMVRVTAQTAALGVSLVALGNTLGRLLWGTVSDKIGRYNTLPIIFGLMAIFLLVLSKAGNWMIFVITLTAVGLCFGGLLSIFPAMTSDIFGEKHSGSNYGLMFCGYALGSFFGPRIAVSFKSFGDTPYAVGLMISTIICVIGMLLCLWLRRTIKST